MKYFVITTNVELHLKEIITLGLTTKKDTDKIGHKGTGFKFTLAYLHRLGSCLHTKDNLLDESYTSFVKEETIKGQLHSFLYLTSSKGVEIPLNITTHLGKDTWNKPWFILRELIQNALDESGKYFISDNFYEGEERTIVQIPLTTELEKAYEEIDSWFTTKPIGVYKDGPPGIFYKGFRITEKEGFSIQWVMDINRDYLSEDRVLKTGLYNLSFYRFGDSKELAKILIANSYNEYSHDLKAAINQVQYHSTFQETLRSLLEKDCVYVDQVSETLLHDIKAKGKKPIIANKAFVAMLEKSELLRQFTIASLDLSNSWEEVELSKEQKYVFAKALRITSKIRPKDCKVLVAKKLNENENWSGLADLKSNQIVICNNIVNNLELLVKVLVHEYIHIRSEARDCSEDYEEEAIMIISKLLLGCDL